MYELDYQLVDGDVDLPEYALSGTDMTSQGDQCFVWIRICMSILTFITLPGAVRLIEKTAAQQKLRVHVSAFRENSEQQRCPSLPPACTQPVAGISVPGLAFLAISRCTKTRQVKLMVQCM